MEFQKIVEDVLNEDVVSGGEASAFGPSADQPYGQNTEGDARNVFYYPGVMTRKGLRKSKNKKKKRKK